MKGTTSALLSGTFFGTIGLIIKLGLQEAAPLGLTWMRVFSTAIFALLILLVIERGKLRKINMKELKGFLAMGAVIGINMSLFITSLNYTSVSNSVLLVYLFPTLTAFFAMYFLHEKVTKFTWIALATSFIGVGLIVYKDLMLTNQAMFGNFLALCASFGCTAYIILARHHETISSVDKITFWPFAFASILLLPIALFEGHGTLLVTSKALWPIIGLGVFTAMAYFTYDTALKYIEAHLTAIFTMVTEVTFAIFLAVVFLGESIGLNAIIGGALILLAGFAAQRELNANTMAVSNTSQAQNTG